MWEYVSHFNLTLEYQDIPHTWRYKTASLLFWHEPIIAHFRVSIPCIFCKMIVSVPADISLLLQNS